MNLRALVVEDEPHSLSRLQFLLQGIADVEIVGTAENGESAIQLLDQLKPDLVLLDIQLPGMTGFDVLSRASHRPAVIFITAFNQYAVKAFEENAVDYLLKPTSKERLSTAVAKVRQSCHPLSSQLIESIRQAMDKGKRNRMFTVKSNEDILLIPENDICFFKAEDKYVFLCTRERSFFYESTLKELESRLDPDLFLRIHKSFIVALGKIRKIQKWFLNDYILEINDAAHTQLRIGRSYLTAVRNKLRF